MADPDYDAPLPSQPGWASQTDAVGAAGKPGMVDRLADRVQRLHEEIEQLGIKLIPVRNPGPEVAPGAMQPQEAPCNRLHEVLLMVENANQRLLMLNRELNL